MRIDDPVAYIINIDRGTHTLSNRNLCKRPRNAHRSNAKDLPEYLLSYANYRTFIIFRHKMNETVVSDVTKQASGDHANYNAIFI